MLWDLHNYSCKKTVLTYEAVESVCVIHSATPFASCLESYNQQSGKDRGVQGIFFITVGERGIVRIWNSER